MEPKAGQVVAGKYRLDRRLGAGGMGSVFVAENVVIRKRVALKLLAPESVSEPAELERFLREGGAASQVRHPGIVEVYDAGIDQGVAWLAMELLDGESLQDRLDREGRLPVDEAVGVAVKVLSALAALHAEGIVHRDVKPANIILARRPEGVRPILVDFGIAKQQGRTALTAPGMLLGTARYLSPEQALDSSLVDARSDLYSLGGVLFVCLSGDFPMEATTLAELLSKLQYERPRDLAELAPHVPAGLATVVGACLSRDPDARPRSAADLARALELAAGGGGDPLGLGGDATGMPLPAPPARRRSAPGPEPTAAAAEPARALAPTLLASAAAPGPGSAPPASGTAPQQGWGPGFASSASGSAPRPGWGPGGPGSVPPASGSAPQPGYGAPRPGFPAPPGYGAAGPAHGPGMAPGARPRSGWPRWLTCLVIVLIALPVLGTIAAFAIPAILVGLVTCQAYERNAGYLQWSSDKAPIVSDLDGDGAPDVVGWINVARNYQFFAAIAAFDGPTGRELWRSEELGPVTAAADSRAALAGGVVVLADPGGVVRGLGARDGEERWRLVLAERVDAICGAEGGDVLLQMTGGAAERLTPSTGVHGAAAFGAPCVLRLDPVLADPPIRGTSTWGELAPAAAPDVAGMTVATAVSRPDGLVFAFGQRAAGTPIPVVAAIASGAPLWQHDVPGEAPLAAAPSPPEGAMVESDRLLVSYALAGGGHRLTAFDVATGGRRWDVAFPDESRAARSMTRAGDILLVAHWTWLDAFDLETGAHRYRLGRWQL